MPQERRDFGRRGALRVAVACDAFSASELAGGYGTLFRVTSTTSRTLSSRGSTFVLFARSS